MSVRNFPIMSIGVSAIPSAYQEIEIAAIGKRGGSSEHWDVVEGIGNGVGGADPVVVCCCLARLVWGDVQ